MQVLAGAGLCVRTLAWREGRQTAGGQGTRRARERRGGEPREGERHGGGVAWAVRERALARTTWGAPALPLLRRTAFSPGSHRSRARGAARSQQEGKARERSESPA
ncbi:unnamed protein product [Boreogadus saida]